MCTSVAFGPTGLLISGSQGNTLKVWDPYSGTLLNVFIDHYGDLFTVAFSSTGLIATSGQDDRVLIYSL